MPTGKTNNRFIDDIQWQKVAQAAFALHTHAVHIWRISISQNLHLYDALLAKLSPAEVERANRYVYQIHRNRFVVRRGLQRLILGAYLQMPPTQLQFALGQNNKPYIGNGDTCNIQYNLSHSGDWALLAVSKGIIGCDIEYAEASFQFSDILPDHFSADEAAYINQQDSTNRFFVLWTRKEAILKGTGLGIGDHLQYTPALDGGHEMPPQIAGSQLNWQVQSFNSADDYMGTIATPITNPDLFFWDIDSDLLLLNDRD